VSADGIEVSTESVAAILAGGIAFDSPDDLQEPEPVDDGHRFRLYPNRETATGPISYRKERMLLYFEGSLRGLSIGAPVEIRGIKIGKVIDFKIIGDFTAHKILLPVLIEYEPQRIGVIRGEQAVGLEARLEQYSTLVDLGLRAQLKTGSILTGQLFVDFDFHPGAEPAEVAVEDGVLVLPTIPSELQELRADVTTVLKRLQAIPVEEIANNLKDTLAGTKQIANSPELKQSLARLNQTLAHTEEITARLNTEAVPELKATLTEARRSLALAQQNVLRQDSAVYHELTRALEELSAAARSIRIMADYLERHPDALLKGKRGTR
jgi:paraquat-inducible protein B